MSKRVVCGICHKIIYASATKGRSSGMVRIGGVLVPVHFDCYYKAKDKAG